MAPKIALVFYSLYGHIEALAAAEVEGILQAGGTVDLFRVPETLPEDVLKAMHAPLTKSTTLAGHEIKPLTDPSLLEAYDGLLLGIPTRYGTWPAQWRAFWDSTGAQWARGAYHGKAAGVFVTNATQGGGQEATALAALSTLTHHGIVYVPLGYKAAGSLLNDLDEVHGGSPWGAGSFTGGQGQRMPTEKEKEVARIQGREFWGVVKRLAG